MPTLLGLAAIAVCVCQAQEVRVWQTLFNDGSAREQKLAFEAYGQMQDEGYVLLKEMDPLWFQAAPPGNDRAISINPTVTGHTMQGLGAALTDSSAWLLSQLKARNSKLYAFAMNRLFSEGEADFSVLRRPIGSSDYTATEKNYTYEDVRSGFTIDHDKKYIIPVLKDALAINPSLQIIGSPWSPPAWMKTNNDLFGVDEREKKAGKTNRLKPEFFGLYAGYFIKYIQAYAAEGITIHAVTLQNEPQFDVAEYPCLRMTADDQIRLVRELGPRLKEAGLDTEIFVHDHNWVLHPNDRKVIGGDAKMVPFELVKKIYTDPVAGSYVSGSAWHCYSGSAKDMKSVYRRLASEFPDRKIYCTEASGWRDESNKEWLGDCSWGLKHNWLGGMVAGASVALQWNLALDRKHGPTLRGDSLAVGLVTLDTDTWNSVKFEREFYAMAHVSKAVRLGVVHLKTQVKNGGGNILVLAVQRPDGSRALVVCNQNKDDRRFDINCGDRFLDLPAPARSITTLCWK